MPSENEDPVVVGNPAPIDSSHRKKPSRLSTRQQPKDWNQMNDLVLLKAVQEHERKWQLISNAVGRDAIDCAERFRTLQNLGLLSPASLMEHHRIHRKPSTPLISVPHAIPRSGSASSGSNNNKPRPSPHVLNSSQTPVHDRKSYVDKENVSRSPTASDMQAKNECTPPNASLSILSPRSRANHQNQPTISPSVSPSPHIPSAHINTTQRQRASHLRKPPSNPSLATTEPISNLFHTSAPASDSASTSLVQPLHPSKSSSRQPCKSIQPNTPEPTVLITVSVLQHKLPLPPRRPLGPRALEPRQDDHLLPKHRNLAPEQTTRWNARTNASRPTHPSRTHQLLYPPPASSTNPTATVSTGGSLLA